MPSINGRIRVIGHPEMNHLGSSRMWGRGDSFRFVVSQELTDRGQATPASCAMLRCGSGFKCTLLQSASSTYSLATHVRSAADVSMNGLGEYQPIRLSAVTRQYVVYSSLLHMCKLCALHETGRRRGALWNPRPGDKTCNTNSRKHWNQRRRK